MTGTSWTEEDQEQKERLEGILRIIDRYQLNLVNKKNEHTAAEDFPFELITRHNPFVLNDNSSDNLLGDEGLFFHVWIIDCHHPKFISSLFQFIRLNIYPNRNRKDKEAIKHLKSTKPLNLVESDDRKGKRSTNKVSILIAKQSSISYQELTAQLNEHPTLQELIKISTPYRIRVPSKRTLYEHYRLQTYRKEEGTNGDFEVNPSGWPMVEIDESTEISMMSSTMKVNQKILQRQWTLPELQWILNQARSVTQLALESELKSAEIGVASSVSSYSLDPPEELGHLNLPPRELVDHDGVLQNPSLVTCSDVRRSTGNLLRHTIVELTHKVSNQDLIKPREPETKHHPTPYLLTNLTVFISHEPCLLCSMALLHSRIKHLFFLLPSPGSGGCGSVYNVHEQDGLNHKFFVWKLKIPKPESSLPLVNNFFDA
ncbi:hypothetical protein MJO29_012750 [Puccinia striiformis f. sp. tritici]|uniref:hypothetical protein n=1 Tax=Puccinia striiformis f. sp. tritici TaxID=168172 RepID=UPI0020083871|nr:hypothetical protein Pst134EA_024202 [Puccinia striiformis f. sp. tritici]KAH9453323.1 hypothetical protein Pst134EA_024202 [Puccinia striiformis f. sp. tritici]KAI7942906.1 hypothetical protein MJO29_012750 [Puccinia striiformis f. sp. tritici]